MSNFTRNTNEYDNIIVTLQISPDFYNKNNEVINNRVHDIFDTHDMRIQEKSDQTPEGLDKYYSSGGKGENHDPIAMVYYIPNSKKQKYYFYIEGCSDEKDLKLKNNTRYNLDYINDRELFIEVTFPNSEIKNFNEIQDKTEKILNQIVVNVIN